MAVSEGAVGAIASGSSRRFGITERELLKRSLSRVMAKHMFRVLIGRFRRRRRRHRVVLVETIQNHRTRASETVSGPRYGPKRVAGCAGTNIIYINQNIFKSDVTVNKFRGIGRPGASMGRPGQN